MEQNGQKNSFYKVIFNLTITETSSNKFVQLKSVIFYRNPSAGQVATPTFSPAAGTYVGSQNVTISTTTDGATIYYTQDGSDPTTDSNVYNGAITISENTTLKAMAAKAGSDNSVVASAEYRIVSIEHDGTQVDPYTVSDAIAAIDAETGTNEKYVTGIVSKIVTAYSSQYGNISYNISVDGTTEGEQLQAFRGKSYNGENFTSADDIQVGDIVVVKGNLVKYNSTYEFEADNQLVSLERPATPVSTTVSLGTLTNVTIELWDGDMNDIEAGSEVTPGTLVYVKPTVATGYTLETLEVIDADDNVVELTENNGSWSFTMPNSSVTINATAKKEGGEQPAGEGEYVKVTSTEDLTDGEYLIVYEEDNLAFDGSLETLDAAGNTISVTIADNKIAATETTDAATFTIATIESGYSIKSASGMYIGRTGDSNGLNSSATEPYENTISIDTDGNAVILSSGGAYLRYNATSGQDRFRYFKSSTYTAQKAIQLYKKVVAEAETVKVTIAGAATDGTSFYGTMYYSDKSFEVPTGITANAATASNGEITLTSVGNVIPAGTAVVLVAAAAGEYTFNVTTEKGTAPTENMLLGTDDAQTITGEGYKYYMLSLNAAKDDNSVGFYFDKNSNGGTKLNNGAHKAYLAVPADEAPANGYPFGDDATGINDINAGDNVNANGAIYSISGQRLQKLQRGINIVNGKKIVVK